MFDIFLCAAIFCVYLVGIVVCGLLNRHYALLVKSEDTLTIGLSLFAWPLFLAFCIFWSLVIIALCVPALIIGGLCALLLRLNFVAKIPNYIGSLFVYKNAQLLAGERPNDNFTQDKNAFESGVAYCKAGEKINLTQDKI